jgi:LysM repeat protein
MNQRVSAPARVLAAIALVCGFLVIVVVVATSLSGDDDGGGSGVGSRPARQVSGGSGDEEGSTPKVYVVQNGDTLTSIAHKTGVSVARIQTLNPGVDPQILISGEKLKLR